MNVQEVEDLSALVARSLEIVGEGPEHEWWFRGHGRTSFQLRPSLFREVEDVAAALEMEARLLREFYNRSRTVQEASVAREPWEILFLMQHHRVPTRLLDWSRNLLIATYFAVTDPEAWTDHDDPPCVFVLDPHEWNKKVLGTSGVASSLGPVTDLIAGGTLKSYEPTFSGSPVGVPLEDAVAIAGPEFASRIVAQRGVFTVFGTKAPEAGRSLDLQSETLTEDTAISKLVLAGEPKAWKQALRLVGIGAFAAFPDLDGLAQELRTTYLEGAT